MMRAVPVLIGMIFGRFITDGPGDYTMIYLVIVLAFVAVLELILLGVRRIVRGYEQ